MSFATQHGVNRPRPHHDSQQQEWSTSVLHETDMAE